MTNYRKQAALDYLNNGWNVIPLGAKSKAPNGRALISTGHKKVENGKEKGSWELFQEERVSTDLIDAWWSHTPNSNIGIVTGRISNIVVVDIDPRNGGDETMRDLHLPPTYIVNTGGGGWHYYYAWNQEGSVPNTKHLKGIEIKGCGGYVVAPPSIHDKTGNPYEMANEMNELTDAPDWLYQLKDEKSEKLWDEGADGADVGKRNDTAASICGKVLSSLPKKLWKTAGWGGLKEWNQQNKEPLGESELRAVFESISARADEKEDDSASGKESIAKKIADMILAEKPILLFDDLQKTFVSLSVNDHTETHPIYSRRFKDWVVRKYWQSESKPPKAESVRQALDVIHAKAIYEGQHCDLSIRVTEHDEAVWYDLVNENWQSIKVSPAGWSVVDGTPPVFKRFNHQLPQVTPEQSGDLKKLLDYVNIADDNQKILLLVYLVSCFVPNIPHAIPVLYGSQGAAKSTFLRVLRKLIDPSKTELLTLPTRSDQLVQQLSHHWSPFYDNVTTIPVWISDALCRAVTGDGFSKRELYTNDEDVVYSFRCCLALNGINIAAQKADLLDRSILFGLERIPPEKRKDERTFWAEFENDRPVILGGIFDALSKALVIQPTIKVANLPRMADFAIWGRAIAEALGYTQDAFVKAYDENMRQQNEEAIREHPVATVVRAFMNDKEEWMGTSSELLKQLEDIAPSERVDLRQKQWPKAANVLSRRLNEAKTNLANVGISIDFGHARQRYITIKHNRNIVDTVESSNNDDNDGANDNSATNEQATLDLIQEHLDPNARFVD